MFVTMASNESPANSSWSLSC